MTTFDIFIRIGLAILIGGAIGWERESCNRPAGFRTHTLVCLSSTIVMMTGISLMRTFNDLSTIAPSYMAAAVISGIGFLGAGTIIRSGIKVKGLTTAASLWSSAGLGLAVGSGFYLGAVAGVVIILLTLTILEGTAKRFALGAKRFHAHLSISCTLPDITLIKVENWLAENDIKSRIVLINGDEQGNYKIEMRLESKKIGSHVTLLYVATALPNIDGVNGVKINES